jgi:hypothetical protein
LERSIIGESHFAQADEPEKACEEHGDEKDVVVKCRGEIMSDDELKIVDGECTLARGGSASHSHATLKGTSNQYRVSSFPNRGEMGFELLRDAR